MKLIIEYNDLKEQLGNLGIDTQYMNNENGSVILIDSAYKLKFKLLSDLLDVDL